MNTAFKNCVKPDYSSDDSQEFLTKAIIATKHELGQGASDLDLLTHITKTIEKLLKDLPDLTALKPIEKLSSQKAVHFSVDRSVKHTQKKIAAFQKEARKLSAERKSDLRDITPVRGTVNRSVSPAERKSVSVQQENVELKETLKKLQMEKDVLKAWKENVLKLPGNFSEDTCSVIQEMETHRKQLVTSYKVLASKLEGIIFAVQKFLRDTSSFQKANREKEGFISVNFYENERCKLEIKLKEAGELKDNPIFSPIESPFRKPNGSIDLSQFSEKSLAHETEVKILKNQLRDYKKSVKGLEIKCAELENIRWQMEKERQLLERKSRHSAITPTNAKMPSNLIKVIENVKTWAEGKFSELTLDFEAKFLTFQQKLSEKENTIAEVRKCFTENLKENLNALLAMNEDLKNSNSEKSNNDTFNVQIENLEYIIEQNRVYSEIKVQELSETIELLENQRNGFMKSNQHLEKENQLLRFEINKLKELENSLKNSRLTIVELEENNKVFSNKIRQLKQKELEFDQINYEKAIMKNELAKLSEEVSQKDKFIIELQLTLTNEERQANSFMEELIFKEKAVKSQLEMMKIELDMYKAELEKLQEANLKMKGH